MQKDPVDPGAGIGLGLERGGPFFKIIAVGQEIPDPFRKLRRKIQIIRQMILFPFQTVLEDLRKIIRADRRGNAMFQREFTCHESWYIRGDALDTVLFIKHITDGSRGSDVVKELCVVIIGFPPLDGIGRDGAVQAVQRT